LRACSRSAADYPAGEGRAGDQSPDHQQPYPVPLCHRDVMLMNGTFGQFVAVLPSSNVVIVRLGETHDWDLARDPDSLITDLLKAFRKT